jgi:hypothetical protein
MKTDTMEKYFKSLFDKIGAEKAPEDFTTMVMRKIEAENSFSLSHALPRKSYWSLIPYLVALILVVPFIVPSINWIINIDWSFIAFDISIVGKWIEQLKENFTGITFSTQAIIISLAFTVLLIALAVEVSYINLRRIFD